MNRLAPELYVLGIAVAGCGALLPMRSRAALLLVLLPAGRHR